LAGAVLCGDPVGHRPEHDLELLACRVLLALGLLGVRPQRGDPDGQDPTHDDDRDCQPVADRGELAVDQRHRHAEHERHRGYRCRRARGTAGRDQKRPDEEQLDRNGGAAHDDREHRKSGHQRESDRSHPAILVPSGC
jgi:hypothetical protein